MQNYLSTDARLAMRVRVTIVPKEKLALHVIWEVANGARRQANVSRLIRGHVRSHRTVFLMKSASEWNQNLLGMKILFLCG